MKCYYHNDREAVATCEDCGRHLCKQCADAFVPPACSECASKNIAEYKREAIKKIAILLVGLIGGFIFGAVTADNGAIDNPDVGLIFGQGMAGAILGLMIVSAPSGWRALSRITSNFFMFLPIVGWVIYFVVKGILSMVLGGIYYVPKSAIKSIMALVKAKKMEDYIDEVDSKIH